MSKHMPTVVSSTWQVPLWVAFHFQSVTSSSHFSLRRRKRNANSRALSAEKFSRLGTTKYCVSNSVSCSREISLGSENNTGTTVHHATHDAKMSQLQQSKSSVASRTAFDVLSVESGEELEDEVASEPEAVVSAVVCVELLSRLPLSRLIPMLAERRRLNHLKQPSERLRRHPAEKRSNRAVLRQGVTRMSHYPHRPPHILRIPKPGNLVPFPKGLPLSSSQSPCLSRRMLAHHELKDLHRHKMVIQPSPARTLHGQHLPKHRRILCLFLTVHSRQQ
jgi:hypothetical protein